MDNGVIKRRKSYDNQEEEITTKDIILYIEKMTDKNRAELLDLLYEKYFKIKER